jgi:hypothetical protein
MCRRSPSFLFIFFLALAAPAFPIDWRPIVPQDLALKQSKVDPNADAETLFRDIRIENGVPGSVEHATTNYLRIKIFNSRGAENYSKVKIEYSAKAHISDLAGRTIHPDGTIVDLEKDAIFDQVETKRTGYQEKIISFVLPSVQPGSIIEYCWKMSQKEVFSDHYLPLELQTDYPVDEVTFHFKASSSPYALRPGLHTPEVRLLTFGCSSTVQPDTKGFLSITFHNVPAYRDEPFSPPGHSAKQWVLIDQERNPDLQNFAYWPAVGHEIYTTAKEHIKINREIKGTAAEIVSHGKTDEEKLALLADYCRTNITNTQAGTLTPEERKKLPVNLNTIDTFKRGSGNPSDIHYLFIALAQAAGYDARVALVSDRAVFPFTPDTQSRYFVSARRAAVFVNGDWKFFYMGDDPTPPGILNWRHQGVWALIPHQVEPLWTQTPLLTAAQSKRDRIADLKLTPEGDLEGDVRELYWGNEAISWRSDHGKQNDAERQQFIEETTRKRFPEFQLTNISVTASPNLTLPVGVSYHLLVKGYAQRTGKRLFLRPSFFTAGEQAYFTADERTNPIYFHYPWTEADSIDVHLPVGFELDHAEQPAPIESQNVAKYGITITFDRSSNTLHYRRAFVVGKDHVQSLDPQDYKPIQAFFDKVHANDEHLLTLNTESAGSR